MLRVEVSVNERAIGEVAAVRLSKEPSGENEYDIYDITSVPPGESVVEYGEKLGTVTHTYEDGAATLVQKMMDEIEELP